MKRYKVLKEFIDPETLCQFSKDEIYTRKVDELRRALEVNGFIEEIPEQPKTIWDLKEGDKCWAIYDGGVQETEWGSIDYTEKRAVGDITLSKEEGEKELACRKAKVILERDTRGFKPDYRHGNGGAQVYYGRGTLKTLGLLWSNDGTLRFATEEDAQASIKAHPKEWKIYLGAEER